MKGILQISRLLALLASLLVAVNVNSAIIHESATMGPTGDLGGPAISNQFLGSRFSLTEAYTITAIGGHLNIRLGSIWGAIVALPTASSLPTYSGVDIESHALVSALFTDNGDSADLREAVNITLEAGDYALIFGDSGLFGTTGSGAMPTGGQSNLPGASFFFWNGSGPTWNDGGFSAGRFVVEGAPVLPEPGSLLLMLLGITGLGLGRARRSLN
jgi:hypothetical protein